MSVTTEADRALWKLREETDEMIRAWASVVSGATSGSDQLRTIFVRDVFEKLLALKDALH